MLRLAALSLFLLGLTCSCRADTVFAKLHGATSTGYIVPKDEAEGWMRDYNNPKWTDDGGSWELTEAQCLEAEKIVRAYMENVQKDPAFGFAGYPADTIKWEGKRVDEIMRNYANYQVQFAGITVQGHREIFCNYFRLPSKTDLDPTRQFIFVYEGGSAYWQVLFNPETKDCSRLQINSAR